MTRMKAFSAFALSLLIAGCIASGTIIIKYELDEFVSSSSGFERQSIDLSSNKDYNDNKDRIRSVDEVVVVGWLINHETSVNQAEIWVSDDSTFSSAAEVRNGATRVFISPEVPANDSLFISWSDGLSYIENLQTLKDYADAGTFYVYGLAANSPFNVTYRLTLVITITAGL